jgi:hypothetical protein
MLLADILFLAIVVYLAYRFIFNFLLPIVRATHQVRQQFRDMRGSGDPGAGAAGPGADAGRPGSGGGKGSYKPPAEDYIDFEEIK